MTMKRLTIEEYLKGTHCKQIFFSAGMCILKLDIKWGGEFMPYEGEIIRLEHDDFITRYYDDKTGNLIEIGIERDIDEKHFEKILYMMYPTGTFIYTDD